MKWDASFETKCQGMDLGIQDQYHAISFPIYQTATFSRSRLGEESGFDYTRQTNPTRSQLESVVAGLEKRRSVCSNIARYIYQKNRDIARKEKP